MENPGHQFDTDEDSGRATRSHLSSLSSVDCLGRLIRRAVELGILQHLQPRCTVPPVSLYADDVVLFCTPDSWHHGGAEDPAFGSATHQDCMSISRKLGHTHELQR
jgi:hypothetical protein